MVKGRSVDHQPSPSGLTSTDTLSDISTNPLDLSLSGIFVEFSHKPVYLIMVGKNFQIYGVQITGKCICESDN